MSFFFSTVVVFCRYYDVGTPSSSLSPASSSCLPSPCSFTLDSPSPPPTTADFCEFFQASGSMFETDFSNLTLSGKEGLIISVHRFGCIHGVLNYVFSWSKIFKKFNYKRIILKENNLVIFLSIQDIHTRKVVLVLFLHLDATSFLYWPHDMIRCFGYSENSTNFCILLSIPLNQTLL